MVIDGFLLLAIMLAVAVALFVLVIVMERVLVAPKANTEGMGSAPVESGERTILSARTVGFEYYYYALVFVLIEALFVLLFLWAQNQKALGLSIFMGVATRRQCK